MVRLFAARCLQQTQKTGQIRSGQQMKNCSKIKWLKSFSCCSQLPSTCYLLTVTCLLQPADLNVCRTLFKTAHALESGSLEGKGSIGHILGFLPKRLQLNRNILDLLFRFAILFKNFHEKQFQNIFNQNSRRMATRKTSPFGNSNFVWPPKLLNQKTPKKF